MPDASRTRRKAERRQQPQHQPISLAVDETFAMQVRQPELHGSRFKEAQSKDEAHIERALSLSWWASAKGETWRTTLPLAQSPYFPVQTQSELGEWDEEDDQGGQGWGADDETSFDFDDEAKRILREQKRVERAQV